ncbi:hypothetical protein MK786_07005 [Microbacterium sp. CFH 31415]|uniref:hypothetical protein n=1 Tax=Microbacterium sp. CFH 31415 TaxID=2921732 RepID=UPI001F13926B|nr:hypothetical protein [Microbacterium sp. CFH 31415]MCH6230484.1 hypothetical protein [Microbacterium sp. CFH 31415]
MEIATSQLSRIWRLALIGAATAFAWIALSLLLGLGSWSAHADEGDDEGTGLLGAVTSAVDRTATTVTTTVTKTTSAVTEVVNTVVEVAPAPVQQPVRQVAQTVGTTVTTVAKPVVEVSNDVVGSVTAPVVDVVTQVPVVSGIVTGTGVDQAVSDLGNTVDDTIGGLTGAVTDTGSTIGQPPAGTPALPPATPGVPVLPGAEETDEPAAAEHPEATVTAAPALDCDMAAAYAAGGAAASAQLSLFDRASENISAPSATVSSSSASSDARGPFAPAGELCPPTASSSGPGGAGPGAWALVAFGPLAALRAWGRRAGPEDDLAPPAPAGSTDVSPD